MKNGPYVNACPYHVCEHVHIHIDTHIHIHIDTYMLIHASMHIFIRMFVHMSMQVPMHMSIRKRRYTWPCTLCPCTGACAIHTSIHMSMHTSVYTSREMSNIHVHMFANPADQCSVRYGQRCWRYAHGTAWHTLTLLPCAHTQARLAWHNRTSHMHACTDTHIWQRWNSSFFKMTWRITVALQCFWSGCVEVQMLHQRSSD